MTCPIAHRSTAAWPFWISQDWLLVRLTDFTCASRYARGEARVDALNQVGYLHRSETEAFIADHPQVRIGTDDDDAWYYVAPRVPRLPVMERTT